jgi:transketolase
MASNSNEKVLRGSAGATDPRANALRALVMDAVQQANSGHPGAPMGMAEMAVALWAGHLRHNPANPHWPDRDRFVLSNGQADLQRSGVGGVEARRWRWPRTGQAASPGTRRASPG